MMEHAINSDGEAAIFVEELAAVPVRGHCAGGRFVLSWVGGSREAVVAPEFEQAACTTRPTAISNPRPSDTKCVKRNKAGALPARSCTRKRSLPLSVTASTHRSEEHTSELQSLMRISNAVSCLTTNTCLDGITTTSTRHSRPKIESTQHLTTIHN